MIRTIAFTAAIFAALASAALAATPVGDWHTPEKNGVVHVSECGGGALCGKLIDGDDIKTNPAITDARNQDVSKRSRPLKGLTLFYGVTGGPTEWSGGSVYNPEDGKTYHGSIKLVDDNTLKLTGCVMAPFCKSQTWTRIQ
jgi:uncharacterized protein (DUF2147 family)